MYQPGEYEDKLVALAPVLFNGAEMGGETGMRAHCTDQRLLWQMMWRKIRGNRSKKCKKSFFFFFIPMISKHDKHKDLRDSNVTELMAALHEIRLFRLLSALCFQNFQGNNRKQQTQIFQQEIFPCLKPFRNDLQPSY